MKNNYAIIEGFIAFLASWISVSLLIRVFFPALLDAAVLSGRWSIGIGVGIVVVSIGVGVFWGSKRSR